MVFFHVGTKTKTESAFVSVIIPLPQCDRKDLTDEGGVRVNGFGLSVYRSARAVWAKSGLSRKAHEFERSFSLFTYLSIKTKPRPVYSGGARQNPPKIQDLYATAFYKHCPYCQEQYMPYPKVSKREKELSGRQ